MLGSSPSYRLTCLAQVSLALLTAAAKVPYFYAEIKTALPAGRASSAFKCTTGRTGIKPLFVQRTTQAITQTGDDHTETSQGCCDLIDQGVFVRTSSTNYH